jgi:hypothetical protein
MKSIKCYEHDEGIERIKLGRDERNKLKNIEFCAGFFSYR